MNYLDALNIMENKKRLGIKPGLDRIKSLLQKMDNPQDNLKIIHVAGTNGKGTVANIISDTLVKDGYKVGLFTSPYVVDYKEQIQINKEYISEEDFAFYVNKYSYNDATEFEMLTAIMYKYFYDKNVDYAVIECGLGGMNDATNVEEKNIAVITSISVDHKDILGDTVQEIAKEKSGIIKNNCCCVLYPNKKTEHIFSSVCKEKNAKLIKVEQSSDFTKNNLNTAKAVLNLINCKLEPEYTSLPARQERIGKILVDGGHNIEAANALAPLLDNEVALIAMMKDKEVEKYLSVVAPKCKSIVVTSVNNPRSLECEELKAIAKKYCNDVIFDRNCMKALEIAKSRGLTLVCGSFYLAREVRKELS